MVRRGWTNALLGWLVDSLIYCHRLFRLPKSVLTRMARSRPTGLCRETDKSKSVCRQKDYLATRVSLARCHPSTEKSPLMIQFLCRLLKPFFGSGSKSDLPRVVGEDEPLARFIFSSEHFAETKGLVKPKAFLPDGRGETSVFRVISLSSSEIWNIGNGIRAEHAKACARIATRAVRHAGLQVDAAPEDHPRHAVIVGWPSEKHRKLMVALLLSNAATLQVQA